MDNMIQRYPLLRLLVPYIIGIWLANGVYSEYGEVLSGAMVWLGGVSLLLMLALFAVRDIWARVVYGIGVSLFFLSLGVVSYTYSRNQDRYAWSSQEMVYEARISDSPRKRERSTLCVLQVTAVHDSSSWCDVNRKVYAYMEPSAAVDSLLHGDVICFKGRIRKPHNFSDSLDFDYAHYLAMQGVAGTIYMSTSDWVKVEGDFSYTLRNRMLRLRHYLLQVHMLRFFDEDALGVLAALTLGDRSRISAETRAAYTDAGAAHALALSGLHVGGIYCILAFIMQCIVRRRSMRWMGELLVIGVLWLFAFMVGMSASVVRAVTMCTIYALARWISKDNAPINVLSLTALIMLLFNPLYLFDVGFQLSFMAMASIFIIEPSIESLFYTRSRSRAVTYLVGIICMSLAAQLGTFPLSLHYFGTFPVYFLITNLLVIPALSLILLLVVVWWVMVFSGISWAEPLALFLQSLTNRMTQCIMCIAQWPGAVFHVETFGALSVLFTYLVIMFAVLYWIKKWPRSLVYALASLLGLLLSLLLN